MKRFPLVLSLLFAASWAQGAGGFPPGGVYKIRRIKAPQLAQVLPNTPVAAYSRVRTIYATMTPSHTPKYKGIYFDRKFQLAQRVLENNMQQKMLSLLGAPPTRSLDAQIHRSVFTVAAVNAPEVPLGSGFVFTFRSGTNGENQLWGATTAEVVQKTGEDVLITFYTEEQTMSFSARVVAKGHAQGNNTALLELPPGLASLAQPIELHASAFSNQASIEKQSNLISYLFSNEGDLYKMGTKYLYSNTERTLAQAPAKGEDIRGTGGVVVNEQGQAVGMYRQMYNLKNFSPEWIPVSQRKLLPANLTYTSEFIPLRNLTLLIREHMSGKHTPRVLLFDGKQIGQLATDEAIHIMRVFYPHQQPKTLLPTPFWTPFSLDQFVPNLVDASHVEIHIAMPNKLTRVYTVDLYRHEVREEIRPLP